eukprot:TRINITY_DN2599_c0_g3_i6.p1 TRINITY_DN2599_c0_g3~~TRINITY_DN2599_c0_g3_i6.p1  ORF type:complete len:1173 (+),score=341.22 TRINITY_DN2599_c0_g3_i6:1282-4800(+)
MRKHHRMPWRLAMARLAQGVVQCRGGNRAAFPAHARMHAARRVLRDHRVTDLFTHFAQDLLGMRERGIARRYARVDGGLDHDLLHLVRCETGRRIAGEPGTHMQFEFFPASQCDGDGQHDDAAGLVVQPGPAPDLVPGETRDQVLEVGIEVGGVGHRPVHPLVSQHTAAVAHAAFEIMVQRIVAHGGLSLCLVGCGCFLMFFDAGRQIQSASAARSLSSCGSARRRAGRVAATGSKRARSMSMSSCPASCASACTAATSTSASCVPSLTAWRVSCSSRAWARGRPITRARAMEADSAKTRPCRASMLRSMRASSMPSAAKASLSARNAPCTPRNSAGHSASSACQLPSPRSCCCAMVASRPAACCGARWAAARAIIEDTGLRLCGMAEEPPRPLPEGSASSAISPCAISDRSVAILPRLPARTAISLPSRIHSSRWVCQAISACFNPSASAMRAATARPLSSSTASVPTAPPSCSCNARPASVRSCARERTSGAAQPQNLKPRLVTCAGCIRVRASTGVSRCSSASTSSRLASVSSSASTSCSASRVTSTSAVSSTSWLVLPQCTWVAASSLQRATVRCNSLTSGIASAPARRPATIRAGMSQSGARHTLAMARAAVSGITPSAASASARACSKRSMACTTAWSSKRAIISEVVRKLSNIETLMKSPVGVGTRMRSVRQRKRDPTGLGLRIPWCTRPARWSGVVEEYRLALALHVDVPQVAAVGLLARDQGVAALRRYLFQQGRLRQRRIVFQEHRRELVLDQAARKHGHVGDRRAGGSLWLRDREDEAAFFIGRHATIAGDGVCAFDRGAAGQPGFGPGIVDGLAVAVEDGALHAHLRGSAADLGGQLDGPGPGFMREGADGLRSGDVAHVLSCSVNASDTHGRGVAAAQDDVEYVAEHLVVHRFVQREARDQALAGSLVGDALEDRVVVEQRVVGEVHLRHQALRIDVAEQREVDMRRAPGLVVVAPGIRAGLDADETIAAFVIGEHLAEAGEVGVQRGVVLVLLVEVAAGGVALPDFQQRIAHRLAVLVQHAAGDHDLFAQRFALALRGQVHVVRQDQLGRGEQVGAGGDFVAHAQRCLRGAALDGRFVGRIDQFRIDTGFDGIELHEVSSGRRWAATGSQCAICAPCVGVGRQQASPSRLSRPEQRSIFAIRPLCARIAQMVDYLHRS